MTDYLWPEDIVPFAVAFYLQPHTGGTESPFSRATKTYGLSAPRWVARMSIRAPYSSDEWGGEMADWGERLDAFLTRLKGRENRVVVWDFRRSVQGALVNEAISGGSSSVTFTGGNPQVGKYVSGDGRPHLIVSVSGATATVEPPFRSSVPAGEALYGIGYGFFRLASDDAGANLTSVGELTTYDIELVEDLEPGLFDFITADYYADSENGSDANDGLTIPTAKLTLGAIPWADNLSVGLVSNSVWLEAVTQSTADNVTVSKANVGDLPLIDGADEVTGWTVSGSYGTVWEKAGFTHTGVNPTDRLTIYEDGVLLARVADAATCATTPGSFVDVKTSDGATVTLRIHPTGSGNPNTNGKLYKASKRGDCLYLGNNAAVTGLEVARAISASGSIRVGADSSLSRVLSLDGTKHNIFLGSGVASDCIAYANDPPTSYELSNTFYVSFLNDATGKSFLYDRCGAVQPADAAGGTTAFLAHASAGTYASAILRQCWASGPIAFDHPGGSTVGASVMEGCHSEAETLGIGYGTSRYCTAYSHWEGANVNLMSEYGMATVQHFAGYFEDRSENSNFNEIMRIRNTTTLQNCAFVGSSPLGNSQFINNSAASGTLTLDQCIITNFASAMIVPTGQTYVGDHNVFMIRNFWVSGSSFVADWHGAQYTTLAAWNTATGQDGASVYLDPDDQTAGNPYAFWLGVSTGANSGPADGDFRINPGARVYAKDDSERIGTFADGIGLTQAGPQTSWDWNARSAVDGPPTKFPNVPGSRAECRQYCGNPIAWNFY